MTVDLFLAWLDLGLAIDEAVSTAGVWGPPALVSAALLAFAWMACSDSVRRRVRTLSAPHSTLTHRKPLTCPDTCPDTSADPRPDTSGHDT